MFLSSKLSLNVELVKEDDDGEHRRGVEGPIGSWLLNDESSRRLNLILE